MHSGITISNAGMPLEARLPPELWQSAQPDGQHKCTACACQNCTATHDALLHTREQPSSAPRRHGGTRPYHAEPLLLSDQQQCQAAASVATNPTPSDMFQSALHALDLFDQTSMEQQERLQQELNEETFEQGQAATQVGRSVYEVGQGLHCSRWLCAQEGTHRHSGPDSCNTCKGCWSGRLPGSLGMAFVLQACCKPPRRSALETSCLLSRVQPHQRAHRLCGDAESAAASDRAPGSRS